MKCDTAKGSLSDKYHGFTGWTDKCIKMHIGRKQNVYICSNCRADTWIDKEVTGKDGYESLMDEYLGRINLTNSYKKY